MPFKAGRLGEIWLNGVDISPFFNTAEFTAKVDTADVSVFKATYHAYIPGLIGSQLVAAGFYDSADADQVRDALVAAPADQLTYSPAGAVAIGDPARLLNVNGTDLKYGSPIGGAVSMNWTAEATAPIGIGVCLHVLQSEALGTITGTGDGVGTSLQSLTGAVAHLHVTAVSSAVASSFKLQDATTIGGAYTDIASGAFTNMTAVGSQRLVIPGTIRQFVRAVAVIGPATTTYGIAVART